MVMKRDIDKIEQVQEWELQLNEFLAIPEWREAYERVFPNEEGVDEEEFLEELVDECGEYEIFECILKEDDRIWTLDWADKDDIDSPMRIIQWEIRGEDCVYCDITISHSVDESVCYVCKDIYCEACANWKFTMREEDAEVVCPRCQTD